jgi:hypothetical protein
MDRVVELADQSKTIQAKIDRFNVLREEINIPDTLANYRLRQKTRAERELKTREFQALKQEILDYWNKTDPERFAVREFPVLVRPEIGSVLSKDCDEVIESLQVDPFKFNIGPGQNGRFF